MSLKEEVDPSNIAPALPVGSRLSFEIKSYAIVSANYTKGKAAHGELNVKLFARKDMPDSAPATNGFLHFVKTENLMAPTYNQQERRIDVYINLLYLPATLAQLTHTKKNLQIRHEANGSYYADINSEP